MAATWHLSLHSLPGKYDADLAMGITGIFESKCTFFNQKYYIQVWTNARQQNCLMELFWYNSFQCSSREPCYKTDLENLAFVFPFDLGELSFWYGFLCALTLLAQANQSSIILFCIYELCTMGLNLNSKSGAGSSRITHFKKEFVKKKLPWFLVL